MSPSQTSPPTESSLLPWPPDFSLDSSDYGEVLRVSKNRSPCSFHLLIRLLIPLWSWNNWDRCCRSCIWKAAPLHYFFSRLNILGSSPVFLQALRHLSIQVILFWVTYNYLYTSQTGKNLPKCFFRAGKNIYFYGDDPALGQQWYRVHSYWFITHKKSKSFTLSAKSHFPPPTAV